MYLRDKWITGLVKSFSVVDSTFIQQGFRRCGTVEQPIYHLTIQDSATRNSYFLKIPTTIHKIVSGKNVARIGPPDLSSRFTHSSFEIPTAIRRAVESKLAEVADYLSSNRN